MCEAYEVLCEAYELFEAYEVGWDFVIAPEQQGSPKSCSFAHWRRPFLFENILQMKVDFMDQDWIDNRDKTRADRHTAFCDSSIGQQG